ncbi:MAG: oxygenase MpaB family protein [Aeromicrobium sp.]|uniref:oxygenase MpaB family protein n=1 Tax=Aeromicrobium sp. TaxID=1871063 RepID=UPI003C4178CA
MTRLARDHWQRVIAGLDPEVDYEQISRIVAQHEFPWDSQQALSFALFRTYAVPSIGGLLHQTGEFTNATQKRHDDTALLLETVADRGLESEEGRAGVRRMNQMHGRYDISNDDMRYVLSTFVVSSVRWIERYGWRRGTDAERRAAVRYHQRLGRLMGIADLPGSYAEFADLMDTYERETYVFDARCRAVADSTLDLFVTFYPRPLRPVMRRFSIALLDDHVREAFGYDHPPRWLDALAHGSLRARGRLVRFLPTRREPALLQHTHRIRSYPGGFMIEQLGTFAAAGEAVSEGRSAAP